MMVCTRRCRVANLGQADSRQAAADALLMDERRGRAYAQRENLSLLGAIGLLRLDRGRGLIPAASG